MKLGLVSVLGLTVSGLLVTGCGQAPPRALYTVNYYQTHENFRREKLKECETNAAQLRDSPDCVNATKAERAATATATAGT